MSDLAIVQQDIYGARNSFASVLTDRSLSFEREAEFAIQALTSSKYLFDTAVNNRQSVINAVTNIAAIGISLNPAKRQAYLVPRDGKICLDISYMGLMDLAMATGSILWAQAELVHENDAFALNGFDRPPTHSYNPFSRDRGEIVGVYVVVKVHTGDYLTTCMSRDEIDGIMNRSQSVRSGKSSPWKTDYGEMAKKTVVKRGYKYWPKTDRLDKAIHYLNTVGGEGLAEVAGTSGGLGQSEGEQPRTTWPEDLFTTTLERVKPMLERGERTIEHAIDWFSAKHELTAQQIAAIKKCAPIEGEVA